MESPHGLAPCNGTMNLAAVIRFMESRATAALSAAAPAIPASPEA
jgi:hypothetical protein